MTKTAPHSSLLSVHMFLIHMSRSILVDLCRACYYYFFGVGSSTSIVSKCEKGSQGFFKEVPQVSQETFKDVSRMCLECVKVINGCFKGVP